MILLSLEKNDQLFKSMIFGRNLVTLKEKQLQYLYC